MRVLGVIPARYQSTRFPGKPLAKILGKPMVCWVADGVRQSKLVEEVLVTSDDDRILKTAENYGIRAVESRADHSCGTERVWEVAKQTDAEIIINIQGDEPAITGDVIDSCVNAFSDQESADVVTVKCLVKSLHELLDPNLVKVVTDVNGFALYFSRSPIPYVDKTKTQFQPGRHFGHVGIYAYRRSALEKFCSLSTSMLEKEERLEQLRGLETGLRYFVIEREMPPVDVNTPDDIERIESYFREKLEDHG